MKIGSIIFLSLMIILIGAQVVSFYSKTRALNDDLASIQAELGRTEDEYQALQAEYEYYQHPDNLEKEVRARFNYHLPDEKLVVIVPKASSTASSTSN